ncbi:MAG: type II/IV secretion system protein [Verrucomicrobia bacterium]|nr:type II/IV secretion system protein [Verrucomicrobiota bacterium]
MTNEEHDVTQLVSRLIEDGVADGASDIHLDPVADGVVVRHRRDGILHEVERLDVAIKDNLVARVKVLANLVVYKRNAPQEGRIVRRSACDTPAAQNGVEFRVATFPTIHGEKVVIRIFDSAAVLLDIHSLGFDAAVTERILRLLENPQGVLLLTGPASSGKTTTIYSALNWITRHRRSVANIITIEDPVEFDLKTISQTQIDPHGGLTFASALRSALRLDPEVLMIGEIRDPETAQIATQAGLTGHLVISTIHCGTAAGVFTRLIEMGIEPFLIASSVTGVVSQRLVRVLCDACKGPCKADARILDEFGISADEANAYRSPAGCARCNNTGYAGRTAIAELLLVTDAIRELVLNRATTSAVHEQALRDKMVALRTDGLHKAAQGVTSLEELYRITMHKAFDNNATQ